MATKRKEVAKQVASLPAMPKLDELKSKLTKEQRQLLTEFWNQFVETNSWPVCRVVHSRHGSKAKVREILRPLTGNVVRETDGSSARCYELTILGVLLTDDGDVCRQLLLGYLEFFRRKFREEPERTRFDDKEVSSALGLDSKQTKILGRLMALSQFTGGHGIGNDGWSVAPPEEVEDFPSTGGLEQELERLLFRWFEKDSPMFREDVRQRQSATYSALGDIRDSAVGNSKSSEPV